MESSSPALSKNIASLFLVQFANYAIPLITLPWLTRVLGPEGFGTVSFITAVVSYFVLFSDYGFNLSATREIALYRENAIARSRVFWATLIAKGLLASFGFVVLIAISATFQSISEMMDLVLIGYIAVVGSVLTPTWYFQGMERLSALSVVILLMRGLAVPATFFFVTERSDVDRAIAIAGMSSLFAGIACLALLAYRREIQRVSVSAADVFASLSNGWYLFVSTSAISLYTISNIVILGAIAGNTAVGYFSAADKVIKAVSGLVTPISQAVYPRITRLMEYARTDAFAFLRKLLLVQASAMLAVSILLFTIAPFVVRLVYGNEYEASIEVFRLMALLPFIISVSNVLGIQTMLPLGMKKTFTTILVVAGAANLGLVTMLSIYYEAKGAAAAVVIAESIVTLSMAAILKHRQVPVFGRLAKS